MRSLYLPLLALAMITTSALAAQFDIIGPPGSGDFGTSVTVLPNGNIVVTDPDALDDAGMVHLYNPDGELISTLTGSNTNDQVGFGGVVVLANGNYLILSPNWSNGGIENAGAVTWADANAGISGVVSATNSLVGTSLDDQIGENTDLGTVTALANGNYVIGSRAWDNGGVRNAGAVTWADGSIGLSGTISIANSLVGTNEQDRIGTVIELANGHFLSVAENWINSSDQSVGAVTWVNGETGIIGVVSSANSLVGTNSFDSVGAITITLANGNYVIGSPQWDNDDLTDVGAATWANGATGLIGAVSPANSLIGTTTGDQIGSGITALANGNYVVFSDRWRNGAAEKAGAATWANGQTGLVGVVSSANSLVGTNPQNSVGGSVTALANGNYVVGSRKWAHNGTLNVGAATWGDGSAGITGPVTSSNSLIGATPGDRVGGEIFALANGNYVVGSTSWHNDASVNVGAATWANGTSGLVGVVSSANSLIGTTADDFVGSSVTALTNGNYVASSGRWDNGLAEDAGAATWGNGSSGTVGVVSSANSLVGDATLDFVSESGEVVALHNGNYLVVSSQWGSGGAVSWGDGESGVAGAVSQANSLVGAVRDRVGSGGAYALEDGNYVVVSPNWDAPSDINAGAVTLASGIEGLRGFISADNSVIGTASIEGSRMTFDYDVARARLVVGKPDDNIVTLFTLPLPDALFANGFENPEVVTGAINLPVDNSDPGSALDLVTGTYLLYVDSRDDDINLYNRTSGLRVYWYSSAGVSTDGEAYDVLQSGAVIGPASPFANTARDLTTNWWVGADGYSGIRFQNEETGAVNYGYVHVTTSAPNGFPAQVLEYAYNNAGNALTIP